MGCDIHGRVELRKYPDQDWWQSIIDVGGLLDRSYDLFGMLFGIRNYGNFEPISVERGLPNNPSFDVEELFEKDAEVGNYHSWTWISYEGIKSIDLEEEAKEFDDRVHEFIKGDKGEWIDTGTKSEYSSRIDYKKLEREGGSYIDGDRMYKKVKMKRKDCLNSNWELLMKLMDILAERYGKENLRLIVWFDN